MLTRSLTEGWSEIARAALEGAERRFEELGALEDELAELTAHIDAARCRWLELISEWHHRDGGEAVYTHSLVQWVAWRLSVSPAEAREYVRVAERLRELPLVRAAFARGQLSYSKVRALTRVADPVDEAELVELASLLTVSQLERCLRAYRRVSREQASEAQEGAFLRYFWDEQGSLCLRARLHADDGAAFLRALEAARDCLHERRRAQRAQAPPVATAEPAPEAPAEQAPEAPPAEDAGAAWQPTPEELRVTNLDALVAMAESSLERPGEARPAAERAQVVVHVDAETLAAEAAGRCQLEEGPAIAVETARRLACDASLVTMLEREGKPLSVGRKTRSVPAALRRALRARDQGCRFPGCENTRFLERHPHPALGAGRRDEPGQPDRALPQAPRAPARGRMHAGGLPGRTSALPNRHGVVIPNVPRSPPSHPGALIERNRERGLTIDKETCRHGSGERMDLALTVQAIGNAIGWDE